MVFTARSFHASLTTAFIRETTNHLLSTLGDPEHRADLTTFHMESGQRFAFETLCDDLADFYRRDLLSTSVSSGIQRTDSGRGTPETIMWSTVNAGQITDRVTELFANSTCNHHLRRLLFALLAWSIEQHGWDKTDDELNFALLVGMQKASAERLERHRRFQADQMADAQ